jgi:hypothetical protein
MSFRVQILLKNLSIILDLGFSYSPLDLNIQNVHGCRAIKEKNDATHNNFPPAKNDSPAISQASNLLDSDGKLFQVVVEF